MAAVRYAQPGVRPGPLPASASASTADKGEAKGTGALLQKGDGRVAALLKEKPLKMVGAKMNPETGRLVLG